MDAPSLPSSGLLSRQISRWAVWPILVLALAAAWSAGRFSAPERVEERVEYRTEIRTVTKAARAREVIRYVERTTTPAGEVRERVEEREREREERQSSSAATSEGASARVVEVRPQWRVGVLAGASIKEPALPLTGPLVLGVSVEHRIAGGVSLGAWANTVGAAGALVSVEF